MKISKAVIISLPNSKRRAHVTQVVASWSLPFPVEIFNAVPKDECSSEIISVRGFTSRVDNSRMLQVEKRTLTTGEIGCMLSHYFVWKDVEGPTLILEDDFVFEYDSNTISNILSQVPEDFDICYFQQGINYLIVEKINTLYFKTLPNICAFGYLISPKFSKKMVETFRLNRQADDYIAEFIMNQAPETKIIASFLPFIKCGDFESEIGLRERESFH